MNQPVQRPKMRDSMPLTARWIDERRQEFGAAHVNGCIRRAVAGEPGLFYAIEAGNVLGTPFAAGTWQAEWQAFAVMVGSAFAAFLARPATDARGHGMTSTGVPDGAH